jgi:signal transduction histidine kinase
MADYAVIAVENARLYFNATLEKNRLSSILTSIQDGVLVCQEDRIVLANQKARELLDQNDTDMAGKPIAEVIQNPILLDMLGINGRPVSNHSAEIMLDDERVYSVQTVLVQ